MPPTRGKNKQLRVLHVCFSVITITSLFLSVPHAGSYLSEEEVLDKENPFVQLVSGVVWLLRSGEIYINESLHAECEASQKSGT